MKCEFFRIERSTCLRPVVVFAYSLERGTLWLCQKHDEEQNLRDESLRDKPDIPTVTISWKPPRDCDESGCLLQGIAHYHQGEGEPFCAECAQSLTTAPIVHIDVEVVEEPCYLGICHTQSDIDAVEEAEELPPRIEWVETAEAALAPPFGHVRHFTQEDSEQFHRYCGPDCVYPDE